MSCLSDTLNFLFERRRTTYFVQPFRIQEVHAFWIEFALKIMESFMLVAFITLEVSLATIDYDSMTRKGTNVDLPHHHPVFIVREAILISCSVVYILRSTVLFMQIFVCQRKNQQFLDGTPRLLLSGFLFLMSLYGMSLAEYFNQARFKRTFTAEGVAALFTVIVGYCQSRCQIQDQSNPSEETAPSFPLSTLATTTSAAALPTATTSAFSFAAPSSTTTVPTTTAASFSSPSPAGTATTTVSAVPLPSSFLPVTSSMTAATPSTGTNALSSLFSQPVISTLYSISTTKSTAPTIFTPSSTTEAAAIGFPSLTTSTTTTTLLTIPTTTTAVTTTSAPTGIGLGDFFAPPVSSVESTSSASATNTTSVSSTSVLGTAGIIRKAKESSDLLDQLSPAPFNNLVDSFITMFSETEQLMTDLEHTSTSKFVNVPEQIVPVQQHVLDIQGDVQRDESTFAPINQTYRQELHNATVCKYLRSLPLGADIDDRVVDNYLMQKVDDIEVNDKQCQDVLDCAEKRLQINGLGVTTEDLLLTPSKNVYTGMIAASSKANQAHQIVEDFKYQILDQQNHSNDI